MRRLKIFVIVAASFAFGLLAGASGTLVWAHGGDTSLIHACVRATALSQAPNIRIIAANGSCAANETALDWNIQGIQGPPGSPGNSQFTCGGCNFRYNIGQWSGGKDYSNSIVDSADFNSDEIDPLDMVTVKFDNSKFGDVGFHKVDLTGASFVGVTAKRLVITSSNGSQPLLQNANFTNLVWEFGQIHEANLNGTNFTGATLKPYDINFATFVNANFTNATFENTVIQNSNLTGAMGLQASNLNNVTWINVICPDSTNSDDNGETCEGHLNP